MESDGIRIAFAFVGVLAFLGCWALAAVGWILGGIQISASRRLQREGHGGGPIISEDGARLRPGCPLPSPGRVLETPCGRFVFDDERSGRFAAADRWWEWQRGSLFVAEIRVESDRVLLVSRIPWGWVLFFAGWLGGVLAGGITLPFAEDPPPWYVPVGVVAVFWVAGGLAAYTNLRRGRTEAVRRVVEIRDAIEAHAGLP